MPYAERVAAETVWQDGGGSCSETGTRRRKQAGEPLGLDLFDLLHSIRIVAVENGRGQLRGGMLSSNRRRAWKCLVAGVIGGWAYWLTLCPHAGRQAWTLCARYVSSRVCPGGFRAGIEMSPHENRSYRQSYSRRPAARRALSNSLFRSLRKRSSIRSSSQVIRPS